MAAPDVPDWTRVVLLSGIDPSGNPITIAVDENGYLVAIMKGEYSGILKNVAVDAAGRLIMIPTDPADVWGNAISMGNAELAARLGVPFSVYRTGNILALTSFEHGFVNWVVGGDGTLNAQELSSSSVQMGGLSLKLTAGSTTSWLAYCTKFSHATIASKIGLELSIAHNTSVDYYIIHLLWYDGTKVYQARIKYDQTNNKIQYYDEDGNYQDLITSVGLLATVANYNTLKLVVDFVAHTYRKLLIASTEKDMTAYPLLWSFSGGSPAIEYGLYVYSKAAQNGIAYLDDIILTQNEPA